MSKVILLGPLSQVFGFREKEIQGDNLIDILHDVDCGRQILLDGNKIKSGFIVLIDGVDWRLHGNLVKNDSIISIIPVNHGG
ncbi:ubiquitin [Acidianus sulfidivorans JP7]|uniref:Ubiquitin n=1 Tax=Acidianus sulfidivorans JP7 TaxID=619593 RepID=A0A2U9IME7_9CREN|nr:ubiquitin [Acidianus sulfidivorans]AWR97239.1 ubiquitin [Acidianus sulfidivorans JP7]